MAEDSPKKKRRIKPAAATVREKAKKSETKARRSGKVKGVRSALNSFFKGIGRLLSKILKPFAFLLKPFKTRPVRFIGRILSKIFLIGFFVGSWKELRQVDWPDRKQTWQLTFAVFVFAIVFGIAVSLTDYGLDRIFKRILLK